MLLYEEPHNIFFCCTFKMLVVLVPICFECTLSLAPPSLWLPSFVYVLRLYKQDVTSLGHRQYTGVLSIKAHKSPKLWFDEDICKPTMQSTGCCMLLHKEQHAMDRLPTIPHTLWVHGQGMTGLGYIHYTRIMLI